MTFNEICKDQEFLELEARIQALIAESKAINSKLNNLYPLKPGYKWVATETGQFYIDIDDGEAQL